MIPSPRQKRAGQEWRSAPCGTDTQTVMSWGEACDMAKGVSELERCQASKAATQPHKVFPSPFSYPSPVTFPRHSCCAGHSPHGSPEGSQAVHGCPVDLFLQLLMMETFHALKILPSLLLAHLPALLPFFWHCSRPDLAQSKCPCQERGWELSSHLGSPSVSLILFILSSIFCVGPPPPSPKPKRNALWFTRPLSLLFFTVFSIWRDFWAAAISWHPAPAPTAPCKKARTVFRVQSPVLLLFPSLKCPNQARVHLGVRHPNSLCPTMLPGILLPSQAGPSPRSPTAGPRGLALPFSCRSGTSLTSATRPCIP